MRVIGLENILKSLSSDTDTIVAKVMSDWGNEVLSSTKTKAREEVKSGFYMVTQNDNGKFTVSIRNNNVLSAYSEFGTGGQVFKNSVYTFTDDDQYYAIDFFKNGKGRLTAQPALYPSYFEKRNALVESLKKAIVDSL